MDFAFLRDFPKRMKVVGLYARLIENSSQKQIWKNLNFEDFDEQINILFSILLFIMEKSLRDEICTIDDIADFLSNLNQYFYQKRISNENCKELAKFVVNDVLSNGGLQMNFAGYNYKKKEYDKININYIANKVIYENKETRRSSYYLTDNGYSLLLGTLEIENHMRLTIQEMIFSEHLKKNNYDKSLDDIKNIFEFIRIEKKKNIEAIAKIRQNILNFTIDEYSERIDSTFNAIQETRKKLEKHKDSIKARMELIENEQIDLDHIDEEDLKKLQKLQEITTFLNRSIECHLDILKSYNNYRDICAQEMENFLKISLVERFSFSQGFFEKILDNPKLLPHAFNFLHPLFNKDPLPIFNINKLFIPQHKKEERKSSAVRERLDFDENKWREEKKKEQDAKNKSYKDCLLFILECIRPTKAITLGQIAEIISFDEEKLNRLIPSLSIFKEIMIELIRAHTLDIEQLTRDRARDLTLNPLENSEKPIGYATLQIGELLLSIVEETYSWNHLKRLGVEKIYPEEEVKFEKAIQNEEGKPVAIVCTNVKFSIEWE